MGSIRRKRSPAVLIAMLGAAVSATALLALDARGSDARVTFPVTDPQPGGVDPGEANLFGRQLEPGSTVVLASARWAMLWPEPLVVLPLLVGYVAAVLARRRLDPVRVRGQRPQRLRVRS